MSTKISVSYTMRSPIAVPSSILDLFFTKCAKCKLISTINGIFYLMMA